MKIHGMPLGMVQANCYIVSTEERHAAIIDPGGSVNRIVRYLQENELTPKMILLTHGHFDHIAALWELLDRFDVPVYIQQEDGEMLENIQLALCGMTTLYFPYREHTLYVALQDGDTVELDELVFQLIHTPGHSKGSSCYQVGNALFTGDTLFAGSMGRTDLYGGSYERIKQSLQRLAALEGDDTVYPGHGECTTLEQERRTNPYLGQVSYDDYF